MTTKSDNPAVVSGSTHTLRTRVDGSLSITVDVEPRHAQAAFAMFGTPGTPIALARLTPGAALKEAQPKQAADPEQKADYGKAYEVLFRLGFFHNPRVIEAFGVDPKLSPTERTEAIKKDIYLTHDVTSLAFLPPRDFVQHCQAIGIDGALPREFREAA